MLALEFHQLSSIGLSSSRLVPHSALLLIPLTSPCHMPVVPTLRRGVQTQLEKFRFPGGLLNSPAGCTLHHPSEHSHPGDAAFRQGQLHGQVPLILRSVRQVVAPSPRPGRQAGPEVRVGTSVSTGLQARRLEDQCDLPAFGTGG